MASSILIRGRSASAGNKTLHNSPVDYGMEPRVNTDLAYSSNTLGGDGGDVRFLVQKKKTSVVLKYMAGG